VIHLLVLISDRVFHKSIYRVGDRAASNIWTGYLNLVFLIVEFILLHAIVIDAVRKTNNTREARFQLYGDWPLCVYYVGCMIYFSVSMAQHKHGFPAIDNDVLRPIAMPSNIWIEKIQAFYFIFHYYLPFVDDLRVIIDWTVTPTSLDLWMHFKVEDAHSWLFRTRHVMFVRRQSFFAEERDWCEKIYNGWLILLALLVVILMPILLFSPITPFQGSVLLDSGTASLNLVVATTCTGHEQPSSSICRVVEVELYRAKASQVLVYNDTRRSAYLAAHPQLTSTDIDVQELVWPLHSFEPLGHSPSLASDSAACRLSGCACEGDICHAALLKPGRSRATIRRLPFDL